MIGPLPKKATNGHSYVLVAIDYFTKWVGASFMAHVTMRNTVYFIRRDIICKYGIPSEIISDNATNFQGKENKWCSGSSKQNTQKDIEEDDRTIFTIAQNASLCFNGL